MSIVFAHRGMSVLAPENTLSAFRLCKEHGVKWFECDVDILSDNTIILTHDSTLDRCTNRSGKYYHLKKSDLADIDAGSWFSDRYRGEKIPTLDELFAVMKECGLSGNIEIKSPEDGAETAHRLIKSLSDAVMVSGLIDRILITSFNYALLGEFKRMCPEVTVGCLFESHSLYDDWKSIMQWVGADYIHPQDEGLSRSHVEMFLKEGYRVNVWTVNALDRANQLFNWGVSGVITDIAHMFPANRR